MNDRFSVVTVSDMADCRENRAKRQSTLINDFHLPVVSFTLNIPGPKKNSRLIEHCFMLGLNSVFGSIEGNILKTEITKSSTGCEALMLVDVEPHKLKTMMTEIEERSPLGRWFDIDVIDTEGNKISREMPRTCFICDDNAVACARSRKHPLQQLQEKTHETFLDAFCDSLAKIVKNVLLKEVHLTPKPGLVDERNQGANSDMNLQIFHLSIDAIADFFKQMAYEASCASDGDEMMSALQKIGLNAERAMLDVTRGVNTHRGVIYSIGLLVSAYARIITVTDTYNGDDVCCSINSITSVAAQMAHGQNIEYSISNGSSVRQLYHVGGAREQAKSGFPIVKNAFNVFCDNEYHGESFAWKMALLSIMSKLDDNNVFHRAGKPGAAFVKNGAAMLMNFGDRLTDELLREFDDELISMNINCGGCADMLACAMFLNELRKLHCAF